MKFLTGMSAASWLKIGAGLALAALLLSWHLRGNAIEGLRQSVANERASHAVTRASLSSVTTELSRQSEEIERQRADTAQAKRDLAIAIDASASSAGTIEELISSSRGALAGPVCEPSKTARSIWK